MEQRTVLFVDDEKPVLNSLKRVFRAEPFDILVADSGQEALNLVAQEPVHIVVSDLNMPEMDGLTLLKEIQTNYPHIVRLVLSGVADIQIVLDAVNTGHIYRYISKPWNDLELKMTIKQAIDVFNIEQEKRELLLELEEHNRMLEKMVEERTRQLMAVKKQAEIGKYAAQIVHNLNNPLHHISAAAELAEMALTNENPNIDELKEYHRLIKTGSEKLGKIVGGILTHSREAFFSETGQTNINEIVKQEIDFFEMNPIYKYKIEKKFDLSSDIPNIRGIPSHMRQVLDNLVKNAIDAMEHTPKKQLEIATRSQDDSVVIMISDTGEGISPENISKIFSADFSTKPIGKGTGLGLASVKTMVESYHGSIDVESTVGKGTTFTVKFPVNKENPASL